MEPPFVADYAPPARPGRRIPPPPVVNRLWRLCLILATTMCLFCLFIEFENFHFDSFFPRRVERPGSRYLKSFQRDIVNDESSWRDWQCMLTEQEDWYFKPLTPFDQHNLAVRIADNPRWNRFVVLVKWGSPIVLTFSAAVFILSILLLGWLDARTTRWYATKFMLIVTIAMFIDVLGRGYLRLLGDRIW